MKKYWSITPEVNYVIRPGGARLEGRPRNALIFGLRMNLTFRFRRMSRPSDELSADSAEAASGIAISLGPFVRRMCSWFRPYPGRSALIILGLLTEMSWNSILPKSLQHVIDRAIVPHDYAPCIPKLLAAL